jgi:hypothetical protein
LVILLHDAIDEIKLLQDVSDRVVGIEEVWPDVDTDLVLTRRPHGEENADRIVRRYGGRAALQAGDSPSDSSVSRSRDVKVSRKASRHGLDHIMRLPAHHAEHLGRVNMSVDELESG